MGLYLPSYLSGFYFLFANNMEQSSKDGWNWLLVELPTGIHQIIIEGHLSAGVGNEILMDDVTVATCSSFGKWLSMLCRQCAGSICLHYVCRCVCVQVDTY